jgi:hypothetical protein
MLGCMKKLRGAAGSLYTPPPSTELALPAAPVVVSTDIFPTSRASPVAARSSYANRVDLLLIPGAGGALLGLRGRRECTIAPDRVDISVTLHVGSADGAGSPALQAAVVMLAIPISARGTNRSTLSVCANTEGGGDELYQPRCRAKENIGI